MLRRGQEADADSIHALLWSAKDDIPLVEKFQTEPYRNWVAIRCKKQEVWVIMKGSVLVATMILQENLLSYLAVSSKYRRKGAARALVRKAKTLCQEVGCLRAQVAPGNCAVARLMETEDFQCTGEEQGLTQKWIGYLWSNPTAH